ncbi:phage portal protein [Sansalvadorimonas verongulae]|uniref:phage portal protein n=1 Tax=Sansalvadorimonas verongulae TaxID=2172824 RepID=UPI0012BD5608|nr:phage portal protein [Sansalvadorimonas verongulae]MTI13354.1 phage portal protein [Sansalvadorimonas verongulae]
MAKKEKLGIYDRLLINVAPRFYMRRLQAQTAAKLIKRRYEGAAKGRRTEGWKASGNSANAEIGRDLNVLMYRSRDLLRNNPWARQAQRVIRNNVVRYGIVGELKGDRERPLKKRQSLWQQWAESKQIDADGQRNFYGLQALAMNTIFESGSVLIRRRRRRSNDKLAVPLQIQVLEPDWIDINKTQALSNGNRIVQGKEYNGIGQLVAYWLFEEHPGNYQHFNRYHASSRRVPASEILHIFDGDRPEQIHGVPWIAPAMLRLRDFDELQDAKLMQQKIASCFAVLVKGSDPNSVSLPKKDNGDPELPVDSIEPGMVEYVGHNDISTVTPPNADGGSEFARLVLREIASSFGITNEQMTGDFSKVNFSSARMGRLEFVANVEHWQWNMLIPGLCEGVYGWFDEACKLMGETEPVTMVWTPPAVPALDMEKEGKAIREYIRDGLMTPSEGVRRLGEDPVRFFDEYADDMKRLDKLGIVLDTDPRKTARGGTLQPDQSQASE